MTHTTRPYFCRGKQRFRDYGFAARLAYTWAARKDESVVLPWPCRACGFWHIGPRPARPE